MNNLFLSVKIIAKIRVYLSSITVLIASTRPTLFFRAVPPTILSSFFARHSVSTLPRKDRCRSEETSNFRTNVKKKKISETSCDLLNAYHINSDKAYQVFRNPFHNILIKQIKHTIDHFELIYTICTSAKI